MKYVVEESLTNFEFWSGAVDRVKHLTDKEIDYIESILDDGKEMTKSEINDFFWFKCDYIAQVLGYEDWDQILNERS